MKRKKTWTAKAQKKEGLKNKHTLLTHTHNKQIHHQNSGKRGEIYREKKKNAQTSNILKVSIRRGRKKNHADREKERKPGGNFNRQDQQKFNNNCWTRIKFVARTHTDRFNVACARNGRKTKKTAATTTKSKIATSTTTTTRKYKRWKKAPSAFFLLFSMRIWDYESNL